MNGESGCDIVAIGDISDGKDSTDGGEFIRSIDPNERRCRDTKYSAIKDSSVRLVKYKRGWLNGYHWRIYIDKVLSFGNEL